MKVVSRCPRCGREKDWGTDDELCWECQLEAWQEEVEMMGNEGC